MLPTEILLARTMAKKKRIPQKLQPWVEARKKYRLSHAQVQMARELGMNPKKFGGLANHKQESWKLPLPAYIEHLYRKRFSRDRPEVVRSIEELAAHRRRKKVKSKEREQVREMEAAGLIE